MICGSGGSKSRLAKAAGAEPSGQMRDEKVHAVVARSTFPSEKVQNTWVSEHFWKLRCRKSARRCGAKHISKSKCTTTFGSWDVEKAHAVVARSTFLSQNVKNTTFKPFLEVEMSKKRTPLWVRTTFGGSDVEKVHAVVARSTFRSQKVKNTRGSDYFWRFRCRFASFRFTTLHYITLHSTTLHYSTLHYTTLHNTTTTTTQLHNYTPLHSITLHYTKLHNTTLRYTTLHSATLHYTTLHYLPLHFTTFHYATLHYTTSTTTQLHSTTLHYTPLH